jgi:hypothetical protein
LFGRELEGNFLISASIPRLEPSMEMKMRSKSNLAALFLALDFVSAAMASVLTPGLRFKTTNILAYQSTQIYAINHHDEGTGIYFDSTGLQHGLLLQLPGNLVTLPGFTGPNEAPGGARI